MRIVQVLPYDARWSLQFEKERTLLGTTLGRDAIHHIGSTSVVGLAAKPIIDILIETEDIGRFSIHDAELTRLGYEPRGELGIPGRRFYPKGGELRTHHVHAFQRGDQLILRHLAFRDYLIGHPEVAAEYGALKTTVAAACNNDINRYMDGKDAWIKRIEHLAILEHKATA